MARQIQLYTPDSDSQQHLAFMVPCDNGEYVRWSDVAPILAEVDKPARNSASDAIARITEVLDNPDTCDGAKVSLINIIVGQQHTLP